MAINFYGATSLTGGGAEALDAIDGAILADGDGAVVITGSIAYSYHLNATSGESESSPQIISPDDNAGDKRWILVGIYGANYVPRGDPASADFAVGNLTTNGVVQDLNLSGIISTGLKLVKLRVVVQDDAVGSIIEFRKKGNSNWVNDAACRTRVAGAPHDFDIEVECDASGIIEYLATNTTFDVIDIIVRGWFVI